MSTNYNIEVANSLNDIVEVSFIDQCTCNGKIDMGVSQCRSCQACGTSDVPCRAGDTEVIQKRIQNQVRAASDQYTSALGALNVLGPQNRTLNGNAPLKQFSLVYWNQMSDRNKPHIQTRFVPGRGGGGGNSVRSSITRLRPGSLGPAGTGVDIKHGSYDRYLNKIKGNALKQGPPANPDTIKPIKGNKTTKFSLISGCFCDYKNKN